MSLINVPKRECPFQTITIHIHFLPVDEVYQQNYLVLVGEFNLVENDNPTQ
jgi:hypothetical protein